MFFATGCASPGQPAASPPSIASPPPEIRAGVVLCQFNEVPLQALENPRPVSELGSEFAPALKGRNVPELDPAKWLIAQKSPDRVMLMSKLDVPKDDRQGDIREYEYIVISTNSMASEPGKPVWALVESAACAPTLDLGELRAGAVTLDPSAPPTPESDRVALLVTEFDCNSGQNAEGRVEVVRLVETESTVEVVIGVRHPSPMFHTCQYSPATPFTVQLERPLGDRLVLNAAVVPDREILPPPVR